VLRCAQARTNAASAEVCAKTDRGARVARKPEQVSPGGGVERIELPATNRRRCAYDRCVDWADKDGHEIQRSYAPPGTVRHGQGVLADQRWGEVSESLEAGNSVPG
jgi:hypothetical protein